MVQENLCGMSVKLLELKLVGLHQPHLPHGRAPLATHEWMKAAYSNQVATCLQPPRLRTPSQLPIF